MQDPSWGSYIRTCILLGLVCYTSNYDVHTAFDRIPISVHTKQPHSAGVQEESVAVCDAVTNLEYNVTFSTIPIIQSISAG